eukprot:3753114-Rhodomonas_salina.2
MPPPRVLTTLNHWHDPGRHGVPDHSSSLAVDSSSSLSGSPPPWTPQSTPSLLHRRHRASVDSASSLSTSVDTSVDFSASLSTSVDPSVDLGCRLRWRERRR